MKENKILRKVIVGSFIGVTAASAVLTGLMIRNCIQMPSVPSQSVQGRSDVRTATDLPETGAQESRDAADSGSLSRNDTPSVIKTETISKSEHATVSDDSLIPLQIEQARSNEEISSTTAFFKERIQYLQQAMHDSGLYFSEKLLDPASGTKAYILAKNENCAQNLNAYFYYLFDQTGSANIVSPFVLNLSQLFDEANRKTVVDSGTFAEDAHAKALRQSLTASLGPYYDIRVFDFIMNEYKRTFQERLSGKALQTPVYKLQLQKLDVVFHNSFMTYVEFFISP